MKMNKKGLAYIAVPAVFALLLTGVYFAGGDSIWNKAVSDFKLAAIKGAPEYTFEQTQSEQQVPKEGEESQGEVKKPLVGTIFGEIVCEGVDLKTPLYYGDSDEVLEKGAGLYIGGSLPGENGTILVGGHDTTFMAPLEKIKKGDSIKVVTTYGTYQYEVTDMKAADVMDETAYDLSKTTEELILYTCYPFGKVTSERTERYYVYAKRVTDSENKEVK